MESRTAFCPRSVAGAITMSTSSNLTHSNDSFDRGSCATAVKLFFLQAVSRLLPLNGVMYYTVL